MQASVTSTAREARKAPQTASTEASVSAISWGAIFGGAAVIGAMTILLAALGSGIGLSSVSPWPGEGASVTSFTVGMAIWLIIVQWLSAALGGYVTGRLRTKWAAVHTDEVFFRDTAHGLLAWAVATVIGVAVLASAASSVVSSGARTATSLISGAVSGASLGAAQSTTPSSGIEGYYIGQLFRSDRDSGAGQDPRAEAARIIAADLRNGSVPDEDKAYLAQLTASRTGISQDEARQRVDRLISQAQAAEQKARVAADQAKKTAALASFYTFFSMLIGAFIASVAGALGGRSRDEY